MDDTTKKIFLSLASGAVQKGLIVLGASLATHGWISGSQTETFVSLGMAGLPLLYSFWQDYGKPILLSQLEVLKAKSLAQAAKMKDAGVSQVTVSQIAAQSPTLTEASVTKTVATLPPSVQATVANVLIAAFVMSLFLAGGQAMAQTRKLAPPAVTGDLKKDINTDAQNLGIIPPSLQVTPTGNVSADLQTLWGKIISASNVDLTYASKLAAGAGTQSSMIRKQCWDAIVALNTQANGLNLKNADGTLMTKPDPHLFTDVETLSEVVDNLSPQGPLFTSCAGAAQLAKTNVLTFINAAVTGAAGIAAMPIIPGL